MRSTQPRPARRGRRFDSPQQEAFLNLWRTYECLRALEEELFGKYGLTPQQYNALRLLRAEHPRKVATLELSGRLVSLAPDITRLLDKLEQRGLVERDRPAGNRRKVQIGITPEGLALLGELREPVRACHARQLGHLSPKHLQAFTALLQAARCPHEDPTGGWGGTGS
jgi:DNA-binding MarR family transcriptional regulator